MNRIVITHCPLEVDKAEMFEMAKYDQKLVSAIKAFSDKKVKEGIETFEQKANIIVTEKGYYCAFWESDIERVSK